MSRLRNYLLETVLLCFPEITFLSPAFSGGYRGFQLADIKLGAAVSSSQNILLLTTNMFVACPSFLNRQLHASQHPGAWGIK